MLKKITGILSIIFLILLFNQAVEAQEIEPNHVYLQGWDGEIGSGYGMRMHPIRGYMRMHNGVDISDAEGTPLSAFADGTVEQVAYEEGGYGNYIVIDTPQYDFLVAHLHKSYVSVGQQVKQGDLIGEIGTTGGSTGPHIHFEVSIGGNRIDPMETLLNVKKHNQTYIEQTEQIKAAEQAEQAKEFARLAEIERQEAIEKAAEQKRIDFKNEQKQKEFEEQIKKEQLLEQEEQQLQIIKEILGNEEMLLKVETIIQEKKSPMHQLLRKYNRYNTH